MSFKEDAVVDAPWQFFLIVCHVDECYSGVFAVLVNEVFYHVAVDVVEAVQRFVEDQQVGLFHKSPRQKYKSLLTARHLQKLPLFQRADAKGVEPFAALYPICFCGTRVESHSVFQSTGHNFDGGDVLAVAAVHLRRHIADVALDVPDAFARTALMSEERDIAGIALWIVCTNQRE